MTKYRNYSDDDIIKYAKEVYSVAGLLRKLDLKDVGGNFATMKKNLQRLAINTDHWTGSAWNKNEQLKDWSDYTRASTLKPHLIKQRTNKCEKCLLEKWQDKPIPLEIHHEDGNRTNNTLENLKLLCPNCHALTENWRGKKNVNLKIDSPEIAVVKIKKERKIQYEGVCIICSCQKKKKSKKYCSYECSQLAQRKTERPSKEELENLIKSTSFV